MLQDDPAFLPDLAFPDLDIDLSALDLSSHGTSHDTSILSQRSLQSSQSSHPGHGGGMPGLVIPTSDSGAEVGGFVIPGGDDSSPLRGSRMGVAQLGAEDDGLLPDVDFEFDADGNLIELDAEERESGDRALLMLVGAESAEILPSVDLSDRSMRKVYRPWHGLGLVRISSRIPVMC